MKNSWRRRRNSQISDTLRHEGSSRGGAGQIAYWSDSDGPESKLVKYDAESVEDFTKDGLNFFESVFRVRKSIVSLVCSADGMQIFCSGTVVNHVGRQTWILTSASLVRKPDSLYEAFGPCDIKIEVFLHNGQVVDGCLAMCNLHYNIAIVTIAVPRSFINLPAVELDDLPEGYSLQPRPVVALGRDESKGFLMRCGVLIRENSDLDCNEILVCTCDVSENFIGGPIMDSENRFLGITFCYEGFAPFLPVEIAARCLKYFQKCKELPLLCIRGKALHMLNLIDLDGIFCKFTGPTSGILVHKIISAAEKCGGIEVGDIISELDGITLNSVAQFTAIFLDKIEVATTAHNTVTLQAVVRRPKNQTTFVAELNVQGVVSDNCDKSFQNRWTQSQQMWIP